MNHATDGVLLAYQDGELDGSARAELREHLAGCAVCTQELQELRGMSDQLHDALALGDVPAPLLRTRAALTPPRRRSFALAGVSGLAKAAMLLIVATGVLAAIPGTPVRRAVEAALARIMSQEPATAVAPVDEVPVPDVRDVRIRPVDGQVRVLVHRPIAIDVTVSLADTDMAMVERSAVGQDVAFRSASGKLEVSGLERGSLRIVIPRDVANATVEIDGNVYVYKEGDVLRLSGPAGDGQGAEVRFRVGQ